ncbi:hypothetical protein IU440_10225 [Nocardia cyriacigeorgica]|uniref:hypothetical protein n=1 Tax=Nocardia cyriacigeorgica TaxID=135487 RepID=UPI001895855D|nr:hypothetical protein [Nocardia cyriacigeorgica]MBF6425057.1 hypothetical protein [Nocardia cyriacigeorgica]
MTPPTSGQILVALQQMRIAAQAWEDAAGHLQSALKKTGGVEISLLEAGIFALSIAKYQPTPGYVADRMREGMDEFLEIAHTLRHVANVYEDEERRNEHALRDLY